MSDLSNNPAATPTATPAASSTSELAELKATCAALESQTHTLRVVLLLVVGALTLFFWREAGYNGALAIGMQPQVAQISQFLGQLEKQGSSMEKQTQALQAVVQRLAEYGKTHPDYVPVLAKYGIVLTPTSAPAAAPAKK